MSFDYSKPASTALSLIAKFGRTIQHISVANGIYDTATGGVTNSETSTDCKGCDFDYKGNKYDGDLVQVGDRYALIDSTITSMDVADKLIIDGVTWSIFNVSKLAPAGVLLLWKVQIRK